MHWLLRITLFGWMLVTAARAEVPAILRDALKKTGDDAECWAYTETRRLIDKTGKVESETVVQFDPSKPYAEQYTPLKIEGKPPTPKQLKEYRKRGEQRGAELERDAGDTGGAGGGDDDVERVDVNGATATVDYANAKEIADAGGTVTYEVPLRKAPKHGLAVEKFQLTVRVNKARRELEGVMLRLLAPIRVMLVAKLNGGTITFDYAVVDPKYPPVMTTMSTSLAASILLAKVDGTEEQKRTELRHVKPFHERFGVKIGTLKALPF